MRSATRQDATVVLAELVKHLESGPVPIAWVVAHGERLSKILATANFEALLEVGALVLSEKDTAVAMVEVVRVGYRQELRLLPSRRREFSLPNIRLATVRRALDAVDDWAHGRADLDELSEYGSVANENASRVFRGKASRLGTDVELVTKIPLYAPETNRNDAVEVARISTEIAEMLLLRVPVAASSSAFRRVSRALAKVIRSHFLGKITLQKIITAGKLS